MAVNSIIAFYNFELDNSLYMKNLASKHENWNLPDNYICINIISNGFMKSNKISFIASMSVRH